MRSVSGIIIERLIQPTGILFGYLNFIHKFIFNIGRNSHDEKPSIALFSSHVRFVFQFDYTYTKVYLNYMSIEKYVLIFN